MNFEFECENPLLKMGCSTQFILTHMVRNIASRRKLHLQLSLLVRTILRVFPKKFGK